MVMTVVLHDAKQMLSTGATTAYEKEDLADLVYADDTLLLGVNPAHLNEYLQAIALVGDRYGMKLHWNKFQLLCIQTCAGISTPSGDQVPAKSRIEYLGAIITDDVHDAQELTRRIALARKDFYALEAVWKRSALTSKRKLAIYDALIEAKLLYGLTCICFTTAQKRHLDAFQNRCLRSIIGVGASYVSRVTNVAVLQRCGHQATTQTLLKRQLLLLGRVIRSPEGHPLRCASFVSGTNRPKTHQFIRRRGRPSLEWIPTMLAHGIRLCGSTGELELLASNATHWYDFLNANFS